MPPVEVQTEGQLGQASRLSPAVALRLSLRVMRAEPKGYVKTTPTVCRLHDPLPTVSDLVLPNSKCGKHFRVYEGVYPFTKELDDALRLQKCLDSFNDSSRLEHDPEVDHLLLLSHGLHRSRDWNSFDNRRVRLPLWSYLGAIRLPDWEPETCPCRERGERILRC